MSTGDVHCLRRKGNQQLPSDRQLAEYLNGCLALLVFRRTTSPEHLTQHPVISQRADPSTLLFMPFTHQCRLVCPSMAGQHMAIHKCMVHRTTLQQWSRQVTNYCGLASGCRHHASLLDACQHSGQRHTCFWHMAKSYCACYLQICT